MLNQDHVYYPGGYKNVQVEKLDTVTHETETVKVLSFSPRCLVAKNGWICCGGETGEFAAIRLDGGGSGGLNLDPDARLPLDLDGSRPEEAAFSLMERARADKAPVARSKLFGKDRVNCITLWFPPTHLERFAGAYAYPVAVLANNDRHVILVKLDDLSSIVEVAYPDCVNRAVLSPDGRLLVAVSDDPYLYIHERVEKEVDLHGALRPRGPTEYEWRPCNRIQLKSQREDDESDSRGSFAACFSNTGKYLAVGTQYGVISIFDTGAFTEFEDGLVTCFTSSNPESEAGAVREMAFCPGPFDLLAWSEDQGAVGVADIRSNFVSRQILRLDDEAGYDHIGVSERTSIDPRLLDTGPERSDRLSYNLANALDSSSDTRRATMTRDAFERYQYPLTPDETQVLEALQDSRRRRETREQQHGAHADYLALRLPWSSRPSARATLAADGTRSRERSASMSRAVNEILGNIQTQRDRIRETHERLRRRELMMTEADLRRSRLLTLSRRSNATRAVDPEGAGGGESIVSRLGLAANPPSTLSGAWDSLEALYNASQDASQDASQEASLEEQQMLQRVDLGPAGGRPRSLGALIRQIRAWEDDLTPIRLRANGSGGMQPKPDETAGLAWSEDGRKLYAPSPASARISRWLTSVQDRRHRERHLRIPRRHNGAEAVSQRYAALIVV